MHTFCGPHGISVIIQTCTDGVSWPILRRLISSPCPRHINLVARRLHRVNSVLIGHESVELATEFLEDASFTTLDSIIINLHIISFIIFVMMCIEFKMRHQPRNM